MDVPLDAVTGVPLYSLTDVPLEAVMAIKITLILIQSRYDVVCHLLILGFGEQSPGTVNTLFSSKLRSLGCAVVERVRGVCIICVLGASGSNHSNIV